MRQPVAPAVLVAAAFLAPLLWTACGGGSDDPSCVPAAEVCNGIDDDCDGGTDEAGAQGCTSYARDADGDGAGVTGDALCLCAAAAPYTATADGDCDDADPAALPGATEACNGVDDDCDAQTDEEIAECCAAGAEQACGVDQGACTAGTSTCGSELAWGECLDAGTAVVLPGDVAEACNGIDDDCDGETDEADAAGCTTLYRDEDEDGAGVAGDARCLCAAVAPYAAEQDGDCDDANAAIGPGAAESCNGVDDDCDPLTPDGAAEPTLGTACDGADGDLCLEGSVACSAGELVCIDGTDTSLESCNGVDDDCDGVTDEDLSPLACANQQGVCAGSAATCGGASGWLACTDATYAAYSGAYQSPETSCDGLDNDCDGATDEELPAPLCEKQSGVCAGARKTTCGGASGWPACTDADYASHSAAYEPSEASCDGIDNDCDAQTDEELGTITCGVGACERTVESCLSGAPQACEPGEPAPEACVNGIDDDCDGSTDETGCI